MTKKQMRERIEVLEKERDEYFKWWDGAWCRLVTAKKELEQKETILNETRVAMAEWEQKYLAQLVLNIYLAEKITNKEKVNEKDTNTI